VDRLFLLLKKLLNLKEQGQKVILVRVETSPEDIAGMVAGKVF
jgi:hypothetical protein